MVAKLDCLVYKEKNYLYLKWPSLAVQISDDGYINYARILGVHCTLQIVQANTDFSDDFTCANLTWDWVRLKTWTFFQALKGDFKHVL